jgi:hypothetical protein
LVGSEERNIEYRARSDEGGREKRQNGRHDFFIRTIEQGVLKAEGEAAPGQGSYRRQTVDGPRFPGSGERSYIKVFDPGERNTSISRSGKEFSGNS